MGSPHLVEEHARAGRAGRRRRMAADLRACAWGAALVGSLVFFAWVALL